MSDSNSILSISGLNKSYKGVHVLRDFTLEVSAGEKLAIIGRSGSGKSTLLRVLMTLEKPDSGSIAIDGQPLWQMPGSGGLVSADQHHLHAMRRKIGMVFQQFNLFPHMNALDNVCLALTAVLGLARRDAEERAQEFLTRVGLADKYDAYPAQLSGGQKQRVAIARALAMQPKVMLFDEITSALDPELVSEVLEVLRRLAHATDMTMLLVTHEMRFAQEIADRVAFVDCGKVVELDVPDVVLKNPQHEATREFLKAILDT